MGAWNINIMILAAAGITFLFGIICGLILFFKPVTSLWIWLIVCLITVGSSTWALTIMLQERGLWPDNWQLALIPAGAFLAVTLPVAIFSAVLMIRNLHRNDSLAMNIEYEKGNIFNG